MTCTNSEVGEGQFFSTFFYASCFTSTGFLSHSFISLPHHCVGENGVGAMILVSMCLMSGTVLATHLSQPEFCHADSRVDLRFDSDSYAEK
jgi:hypothetical protein